MSLRRLHELHEEIARAISRGTAPAVEAALRCRFLEEALPRGGSVWAGFGFPVALALARTLLRLPFEGCDPHLLDRIERILRESERLPTPPWPGSATWPEERRAALARIETGKRLLSAWLAGEDPERPAPDPPESEFEAMIRVPVVSRLGGGSALLDPLVIAQIVALRVSCAVGTSRSSPAVFTVEGSIESDARRAMEEALRGIDAIDPGRFPPMDRCLFRLGWDGDGLRIAGRSASLALLLAAAAARNAHRPGTSFRRLSPRIAATGLLAGTRVLPVDPETLPEKVRASFFSPVLTLYVPATQRGDALRTVRRLEELHPDRQLAIRGIEDAREIWEDPTATIAVPRRIGQASQVLFRRLATSRAIAAIGVAILLLAGGVAGYECHLSRPFPASAEWAGSCLLVRNESGRVIHSKEYAEPGPRLVNDVPYPGSKLAVHDLDGAGPKEVLVVHSSEEGVLDLLSCLDRRGRVLWSRSAHDLTEPGGHRREDMTWIWVCPTGRSPGGAERLLAIRRSHQHGLSLVDLFDGATGERLGLLRNPGHLERICRVDPGVEGTPGWVVTGTDNLDGVAVCFLLDLDRMRFDPDLALLDRIPLAVDRGTPGPGCSLALRFRKTRFDHATRPHVDEVRREEEGLLRVTVDGSVTATTSYYFRMGTGEELRLVRVRIHDSARAAILKVGAGSISAEEIEQEEARLTGAAEVLTGEGWRPVPVEAGGTNRAAPEILSEGGGVGD